MEEEQQKKLDRLKLVRRGHRSVLTKLTREIEGLVESTEPDPNRVSRLKVIYEQLDGKMKVFSSLDGEIVALCPEDDIEREIEDSESIIAKVIEGKRKIDIVLKETPRDHTPVSALPRPDELMSRPRLPKLTLPKFRGDVTSWSTFWDSYKSAVHDNAGISVIDKFNYLSSLLEGPAHRAIQGLTMNESNYASAIKLLQDRFGKPQLIISAHMEELLKLPACTTEKSTSLRFVYDKINVNIRGLDSLGIKAEQYGSLLIPIIMTKLPPDLRLRFARDTDKDIWEIKELMELVKREVEARETSEGVKAQSMRSSGLHAHGFTPSFNPCNSTASALVTSGVKVQCVYCGGDHFSASCTKVTGTSERKSILLSSGRCFNCLKLNHKSRDCQANKSCRLCKKRHHQSICNKARPRDAVELSGSTTNQVETTTANTTNHVKNRQTILLQTARVMAFGESDNQSVPARILFDNGSQMSYITERLQKQLNLKPVRVEKIHLNTFGSTGYKTQSCKIVKLFLQKPGCQDTVAISALSSPIICSPLPSAIDSSKYPHLQDLQLADDGGDSREAIDVLIGSNFYWNIVTGNLRRGEYGPTAISSKFGWLLSGPTQTLGPIEPTHVHMIITGDLDSSVHFEEDDQLIKTLKQFWETETIGILDDADVSQTTISDFFLPSISFSDDRYEIELPWKESNVNIPTHLSLCENRLRALQRRFRSEPQLLQEYDKIIQEQLRLGIVELVSDVKGDLVSDRRVIHYLPHHGVVRKDSQTTKLRVVYDGSARDRGDSYSLNDYLQKGPNYIPKLFDILVRFRWNRIAVTADIEKAFLMISVHENDRDVLRFLWLKQPSTTTSDFIHLRFTRLVFGLRPSPAILGAVITHHLSKYRDAQPDLIKKLENSLYVDDLVSGAANLKEAFKFYVDCKQLMDGAGMNLRKWSSNSAELLAQIKRTSPHHTIPSKDSTSITEEDESYAKATTGPGLPIQESDMVKLLGIHWNTSADHLVFDFTELLKCVHTLSITKRSLLRLTAKIFDPLGFLSPFVIQLKVLFQRLCTDRFGWDDPLPDEVLNQWQKIITGLNSLNHVKVPRCYFYTNRAVVCSQLHGFSDASDQAFAAVVYIRSTYNDGSVEVRIVGSKTRVTPTKKPSIPRLELLGALILARLVNTISKSLSQELPVLYWTDSTTTLHWIRNPKQWKQYVNHRVAEIRRISSQAAWRHCPGPLNPADLPSRGISAEKLSSCELWWNGPSFLQLTEDKWPALEGTCISNETIEAELVKNPLPTTHTLVVKEVNATKGVVDLEVIIEVQRFSQIGRLLRVTALVLRFVALLKQSISKEKSAKKVQDNTVCPTPDEVNLAEVIWVRTIQAKSFDREIQYLSKPTQDKPIRVDQFKLFIDENNILRSQGRIGLADLPVHSKNPILLPTRHPVVNMLIYEIHLRTKHSGTSDTLATLRERYWVLRGRQTVKSVLKSCKICAKLEGLPFSSIVTPDLPLIRVSEDPPFTHTGVDYAGPLYTHERTSNMNKVDKCYICVFTCASTRAIHLELAPDLSVESFLLMFRRFAARRGLPATLVSDNAKTFKTSSNEIVKIARSSEVLCYLRNHRISWRFIVERAPWWGGFWERLIRSIKRCLKKCIGRANLAYNELNTLIVEVECIINSRPITYLYDDQEGITTHLSPSHLIYGRKITALPNSQTYEVISTHRSLTRRAKLQRHVLSQFTNKWRRDYLLSLREHHLGRTKGEKRPAIAIGDVVIVKDDKLKRCFWKLAIVTQLISGNDGHVRAAVIKVGESGPNKRGVILRRSIRHLYPIEVKANETESKESDDKEENLRTPDNLENTCERPRRQAAIQGELIRRLRNKV